MKSLLNKCVKNVFQCVLFAAFVLLLNGCCVSDIRVITIDVHDANVNNPSCVEYMEKVIVNAYAGQLVGTDSIKVEPGENGNEIFVTYDAMSIGRKNIEDVLAQNGFNAGSYKADSNARKLLPSDWFVKTAGEQ